ncbi:hypothetical protein P154DRAFT_618623 [Amniculicola lignicola CBS 123094]|uniref:Uncharacterized protein n=1 Tax=Amniculicola lignicola CBS 123094 TaxID=1392246 RepID=A0A6A5WP76_9PLEO|nr:hypothetical protein P154DRAFT_618623 [Amniculicola lignicola CBS 123094]
MVSSILKPVGSLALAITMVVAAPTPTPHDGMINLPGYQDVGVVFSGNHYQNHSKALILSSGGNHCYSPNDEAALPDMGVGSAQICKPVWCTLFIGPSCWDSNSKVNLRHVTLIGPGDLPEFKLPNAKFVVKGLSPGRRTLRFQSYTCSSEAPAKKADLEIKLRRRIGFE